MKIFRNNKCYLIGNNIFRRKLPEYFEFDIPKGHEGEYIVVSEPNSIEYVRNREDLLNYDVVGSLNSDELNNKINEAYSLMDNYFKVWLDEDDINDLKLDNEEIYRYRTLVYISLYNELKTYKNNKELIDNRVKTLKK